MSIFIPALLVSSGICFFAGIQFCMFGLMRRQEQVFLAFGILCLLLGVYMIFSAQWYLAGSVNNLAWVARYEMGLICLMYPVFIWFLGLYSKQKSFYKFLLALSIIFGGLFVVNIGSPYSFLYNEILPANRITFPWGETVSNFKLKTSSISWLYYAATYAVFAWAFYCAYVMWKSDARLRAVAILTYITAQFAVIVHGELIDNLHLNSVYLGEFVFLLLVLLVSTNLIEELRVRSRELEESVHELREETVRRHVTEQKLIHMAHHDYLTELPNRRALTLQLDNALQICETTNTFGCMLLIDLDNFKVINDSLGHDLGDSLLQMVAQRLKSFVKSSQMPIRLGGDEFAIIFGGIASQEHEAQTTALSHAKDICNAISRPYQLAQHEFVIGASIGVALFDSDCRDLTDIMKHADMALYHAKSMGRNGVELFAPHLKEQADLRLTIDKGLRKAIENGDIKLYYQPQVDVEGRLVGAEVLSRWQHPVLGYISPLKFIAAAEETGLIHTLGENILWQACKFIKNSSMHEGDAFSRLSVNVSPWQLDNPAYADKVMDLIVAEGVNPSFLNLEITESTFLRNINDVSAKMKKLSAAGITFSIDDFGTGYSALAWLKKLSLHELKVDKMFIHEMSLQESDKMIETILSIARHMGLRVVAEGVETQEQRNLLEKMGCRIFQGYLISHPLPQEEFVKWLKNNHNRMEALQLSKN